MELVDGRRTVDVGRDQIGLAFEFAAQLERQLGAGGGLARALQAHDHDDGRRAGQVEVSGLSAEDLDELLVDDLHDLLAGIEALEHVLADGPFPDAFNEVLDDLEIDVGLKQGQTHFAQRGLNVFLGQPGLAPDLAENVFESVCKAVEHGPGAPR